MNALPPTVTTHPITTAATVAVLPIGSFEQHGPHLPLVTDTLVAAAIAAVAAERHLVLQLAPITFSCSHEHAAYPGTVSISSSTLTSVVTDIAESLHHQGIDRLVLVNGHGGNYVLHNVVSEANVTDPARMALFPAREDWQEARAAAGIASSNHEDMHAGELETSILLAAFPDYLQPGWESADHTADDRRLLGTIRMDGCTDSGVIGLPSKATEANGYSALRQLAENIGAVIGALGL